MGARTLSIGDRQYTVQAPRWWRWTQALERGAGDSARLLEECLLACLEGESRETIRALPVGVGDQLMAAALRAVEEERLALRLEVLEGLEVWRVRGTGVELRLHPWTFGERNEALRRSLRLVDGRVSVDLAAYEMQMLQSCVTTEEGEHIGPQAIAEWPVALGEVVIQALDRLNGVAEEQAAILEASVRQGYDHPDLALLYLCQHFGWRPEQVERMDARLAERLLAALRLVDRGPAQAAAAQQGEGVNRIIVEDD
ncbi:MAG: hypothetical protein ACOY93_13815 [Bacillota bacterium]